jgi:hypothetical protein
MAQFQIYDDANNPTYPCAGGTGCWDNAANQWAPCSLCYGIGSSTSGSPRKIIATSKFVGFMGIDGSTESYIPFGVAALGGVAGFMLHKKYPKFGMAGKIGYIGIGAAAGYFGAKAILKKK